MQNLRTRVLFAVSLIALVGSAAAAADSALVSAVASPQRNPAHVARDPARHPVEELTFFGLAPGMTVVELWPGGGYWTEILGPYLATAADLLRCPASPRAMPRKTQANRSGARGSPREETGSARSMRPAWGQAHFDIAPPGSADLVLTFRNLHNWMEDGYAEQALAACFKALKPGGILGIEEHRGRNDKPQDPKAKDGYVRQDYAIALAKKAGFVLVGSSEINANPQDTKDWVDGVWTLPPTLSQGDKDRAQVHCHRRSG